MQKRLKNVASVFGSVIFALAFGWTLGIGIYTFIYAKGISYLSNDPKTCVNCHIMQPQYDSWIKSTHHAAASCNDCHTPHNLVGKYTTKALNGFWHSYYFTTGNFKEPIQITDRNKKIAEANCRSCHSDVVQAMDGSHERASRLSCVSCHGSVGHP